MGQEGVQVPLRNLREPGHVRQAELEAQVAHDGSQVVQVEFALKVPSGQVWTQVELSKLKGKVQVRQPVESQ